MKFDIICCMLKLMLIDSVFVMKVSEVRLMFVVEIVSSVVNVMLIQLIIEVMVVCLLEFSLVLGRIEVWNVF